MRPNLQRPNNLNRYDIIMFPLLNIFKFLFIIILFVFREISTSKNSKIFFKACFKT